ncbi:MAG: hypothetical protein DMD25_10185 [Gemmatimonadetes bacterium]|nr:MAG: hypothetical protein DMD25_10185 [Gemmatimonadota bacterium]
MSRKLELAVRRNRRTKLLGECLQRASQALRLPPEQIELASLEQTDSVRSKYGPARVRAERERNEPRRTFVKTPSREVLERTFGDLKARFPVVPMYLFLNQSEYCGAVRVESSVILDHVLDIISLDDQDLLTCTEDGSVGLFCAHVTERADGPVYRFQAWY